MKKTSFKKYCIISLLAVLAASAYPIYMGISIMADMIRDGTVMKENYPKYVIPYTPISAALLVGVILLPLFVRRLKKFALPAGCAVSLPVFFALETVLEKCVTVTSTGISNLESWQMYMCYVHPEYYEEKVLTPVDILIGNYSPAFKLHFYFISVLLIITILNSIYGFAKVVLTGDRKRVASLTLQSVSAGIFLALCILACFTAFWRDGRINVSPISAVMMSLFFIIMGVTSGIFAGSFFIGKKKSLSVILPAAVSLLVVTLMYIGEMILLNGKLYVFGSGILFDPVLFALTPIDIAVIIASSLITALISVLLRRKR